MSGVKRGDLAVLKWPPWQVDRFERIRVGESRRSITLWDNPEMKYKNGRFPNRAIWGDQVVLILNVMNVIVELGVTNRMAHIFAPEGFGWVLADNLEGVC